MEQWEVQIHRHWDAEQIARIIESTLAQLELRATKRMTLRTYPGSVHWHFKRSAAAGTMEVTMWPQRQRVWISVQSRRSADWIDRDRPTILRELERALATEQ